MDSTVEAQNTFDTQTESNTGTVPAEGANETFSSEHDTIAASEEQARQIPNRKMVHSLKLSPLATTVATADMTRTHSDYQIYKAGVLLRPLNKRFQSDDTINMDTGIALASSTPIQSLLAKRISNSNISPVTNSNNSSTISSNISNHVGDEEPGYSTVAGVHPPESLHNNKLLDHPVVEGDTTSDEDPGYSVIAEVFPDRSQLPNINTTHTSDNIPVTDTKALNHIANDNEDPGYSAITEVFPDKNQPSNVQDINNPSNHIPDDDEDPSYSVIADVFPNGVHSDHISTIPVVNNKNDIVDQDPSYSSIAEVYPASNHLPITTTIQETVTEPTNVYAKVNKPAHTTFTTITPSDATIVHDSAEVLCSVVVSDKPSSDDNDPSLLYAKVNKTKKTELLPPSTLQSKDGAKVTFADEADSNQLSHVATKQDNVTLRHGSNLKVKSSSSQDVKNTVVDDPRRHSAMPTSPQSYGVDERTTRDELSYDDDRHKMTSSDKLKVRRDIVPSFYHSVGSAWSRFCHSQWWNVGEKCVICGPTSK